MTPFEREAVAGAIGLLNDAVGKAGTIDSEEDKGACCK
jgi:hypothetical protein